MSDFRWEINCTDSYEVLSDRLLCVSVITIITIDAVYASTKIMWKRRFYFLNKSFFFIYFFLSKLRLSNFFNRRTHCLEQTARTSVLSSKIRWIFNWLIFHRWSSETRLFCSRAKRHSPIPHPTPQMSGWTCD